MLRIPASRSVLDPEDAELVDAYYDGTHAYHVTAAFVLAGIEPPAERGGFSGAQMKIIDAHYAKYTPNGVDDDGLDGIGPLIAKK